MITSVNLESKFFREFLTSFSPQSDDEDEEDGKVGDMGAVKKAHSDKLVTENRRRIEEDNEAENDATEFRFAKHRHGWFNRLFRTGRVFDDAQLLTWKKSMIKKALLKQNRDLDEAAVQAFKSTFFLAWGDVPRTFFLISVPRASHFSNRHHVLYG